MANPFFDLQFALFWPLSLGPSAEPPDDAARLAKFRKVHAAGALLLAASACLGPAPAQAAKFEFDQRRTEVRFTYRLAYSKQRGRFTKVRGTLDYDDAKPGKAKIDATIASASLTTGEPLVDNELKGQGFSTFWRRPPLPLRASPSAPNRQRRPRSKAGSPSTASPNR